jgi:hypothetical protein
MSVEEAAKIIGIPEWYERYAKLDSLRSPHSTLMWQ